MHISIAMIGLVLAVVPSVAQKASTDDIFEMRRKCQMLAEKKAETPQIKNWKTEVTSNFSITTFHCYLLSEQHPIKQSTIPEEYILVRDLRDGITNELLATLGLKGSKIHGEIMDQFYKGPREKPEDVIEYMDKMMNPQR
jgi:hypothetical protein